MTALLISIYIVTAAASLGMLAGKIMKSELRFIESFSLGFSLVLLGGLVFYERTAFEYYAFVLMVFPVVWAASIFVSPEFAARSGRDPMAFGSCTPKLVIGSLALVLVTVVTRLPVSNFLFEIGDAGSYINSANSLAETGRSTSQFFPLNQILLGLFSSLGGFKATPYGVVFAGLLSVAYAYFLSATLFEDRKWGVVGAFLVAFNVLSMWFSRLPYSETLMLAINLGALFFYVSASQGTRPRLNYLLFGLFVALACANRVTGIVWMMLLTVLTALTVIQNRNQFRQLLPGAIVAVFGYLASIYVALKMGPGYYMEWQIKEFIPFIDSRRDLVVFHVAWLAVAAIAVAISYRFDDVLRSAWEKLARVGGWVTALILLVLLPVAVLLVSGGEEVMGATFMAKVMAGDVPQDVYFLWNYFTPLSLLLFPIGVVWAVWKMNPFVRTHTTAVWLFSFLFLIVHYVRIAYEKPHDVYLYWDRYFLSEVFIVFAVVLTAGMAALFHRRWTRAIVAVFLAGYFAYGAAWVALNRDASYLDGAEEMFTWLNRVTPRSDSVVLLDADYEGRWLFPNLRRPLMIPLARSFGYNVDLGPRGAEPFTPDIPVTSDSIEGAFEKGKDVFVIRALRYRSDAAYLLPGTRSTQLLAENVFNIEAKAHFPGRVFTPRYKDYPLYLAVYRVRDNAILPGEVDRTGFHTDRMWTNGDARLFGFERCSDNRFRAVTVSTGGNHPWSGKPERIQMSVTVNELPAKGEWLSPKKYRAELPAPIQCVNSIAIHSSTFVPAELGMNSDLRRLGLDVVRIKPEE